MAKSMSSIVREWTRLYKPMMDGVTRDRRRFFMTDSFQGMVEFAKGIPNTASPCVVMESNVEGYVDNGRIFRNYPIYFYVRARAMSDGDAAAEAKEAAWKHAQNFLTWLREASRKNEFDESYNGIILSENIDIETVGPLENGWFAVLLQLERDESMDLCVDEGLYLSENDSE